MKLAKIMNRTAVAVIAVFLSCCSTFFILELVLKEDPGAGNLVAFSQFIFIAAVGFCTVGKFGIAKRKIPFKMYMIYVGLFWTSTVLSNYAYVFNISMPLHMVFGAGSLMANMAMGIWILKKQYAPFKYFAIFMISVGIIIFTIESSGNIRASRKTHEDAVQEEKLKFIDWLWWCLGIVILSGVLVLQASLGVFQEILYSKHGNHPWEVLYYTHLLPLFLWLPSADSLIYHASIASKSLPIDLFGINVPRQVLYLILLVIAKVVCVSAVFVLTSECAALTVNVTLTLRKIVSLLLSIWYFENPFLVGHWVGAFLVFSGTLIFTELLQKTMVILPSFKNYKKYV